MANHTYSNQNYVYKHISWRFGSHTCQFVLGWYSVWSQHAFSTPFFVEWPQYLSFAYIQEFAAFTLQEDTIWWRSKSFQLITMTNRWADASNCNTYFQCDRDKTAIYILFVALFLSRTRLLYNTNFKWFKSNCWKVYLNINYCFKPHRHFEKRLIKMQYRIKVFL